MKIGFSDKSFTIFCLVVIVVNFIQILYFERSFFLETYDITYWKDRVEHSQWVLPLSRRIVGDDGLFSYVGFNLINGADPSMFINPETPPLGKYLIGLSILIFKNPAYYALTLGIGSLIFFYLISKRLFGETRTPLFLTTLLFLDPLFFTQLWKAWVDIPQLFFLLVNICLFLKIFGTQSSKRKLFLATASGLMLGFFTQTKPAILLPVTLFIEVAYLLFRKLRSETLLFTLGLTSAIFLMHIKYFLLGHTFLDFFRLQKYIVDFYMKSQLEVHIGAIWSILFLGRFPDIVTGSPTVVDEWWILWPIITLIGIIASVAYTFKKSSPLFLKGVALFLLTTLLIYTLIPFYPRYLLIIMPLLYLFSAYAINQFVKSRLRMIGFTVVLIYGFLHATFFLLPNPDSLIKNFFYNFPHQYFQDIYQENLAKRDLPQMSRNEFRVLAQSTLGQATVRSIEIQEKERDISRFANHGIIKFDMVYKTQDLGSFTEMKTIKLVKENSQWKILWDWDLLLEEFRPGYMVKTSTISGKRGKIIDGDGHILAQDVSGYLVSINPEKIDRAKEGEMLELIGKIGYQKPVHLQNAYLENVLPGSSVPLVTSWTPLIEEEKQKLVSYPGVTVTAYPARIYSDSINPKTILNTFYEECCTRIYSSYNYHGILGPEKAYDPTLSGYLGGTILIKDNEGKTIRIVLQKDAKSGQDIVIR